MKQISKYILATAMVFGLVMPQPALAQLSAIRSIIFPVIGTVTYYDDFGNARDGGARSHEGNDLFAKKMTPLVAAVDGTIVNVNYPEESWGMAVTIRDKDGFTYHYIHMNNDTPGTDDGNGDGINAYAVEVMEGNKVVKGQLIGYIGDSGNAETTPPHLHFEIRQPDRQAFSPYQSLKAATKITSPVPAPKQDGEILPYEEFNGGASLAAANLDKDEDTIELVTGAGPGGGPLVKVFDEAGKQLAAFYAYDPNFSGGVDVAAADVDDDGVAEIITAPGPGGGPHIRIFDSKGTPINNSAIKEFFAYDTNFTGGVFIDAGDIDNDGVAEIATGAGPGGGPHVKIFKPNGSAIKDFFPYDSNFRGGVDVAVIPAGRSSSRNSRITPGGVVTAPGPGGGPHVRIYDEDFVLDNEFFAYDGNFNVGLRVSAGNADTSEAGMEIATVPATSGGPHAKLFSRSGEQIFSGLIEFEPWWRGGYDIALHDGGGYKSSFGGRRASVREASFRSFSLDRDWRDRN